MSRKKQKEVWPLFLVANIAMLLLSTAVFYFKEKNKLISLLADWLPLLLILFYYQNAGLLSKTFFQKPFDDKIIALENKIFRSNHPCMWLSETANAYWLSEFLHFCYIGYYFLLYGVPFYLYMTQCSAVFYQFEYAQVLTLLSCFFTHAFIPVLSPRTIFEKIKQPLNQGHVFRAAHYILEKGSASGTAFPSSHVAIGTLVLLVTFYLQLPFLFCVAPFALGLIISTVYGRFHYVIDFIFGGLYGCLVFWVVYLS
jgi:membrane-associated phospholipid phosphatase